MPNPIAAISTLFLTVALSISGFLAPISPATAAPEAPAGYDETLTTAITDIQQFWAGEFPRVYGEPYQPIPEGRIIAAAPGVAIPKCAGETQVYRDVVGNAFYCFGKNFIAFDNKKFFPDLYRDYGSVAVPLILAHEWGHAIQDRAGITDAPNIVLEQQADCFAGAWLGHVNTDGANGIELLPGDQDIALSALLSLRDATGSSGEDPDAHGSGFDRVAAFQDGFDNGATKCATYYDSPPENFEIPFINKNEKISGGEIQAGKVIPVAVDLLNSFYSQVMPDFKPLLLKRVFTFNSTGAKKQLPECGGQVLSRSEVENRFFYCIDDNYVAFDEPYAQYVYESFGDFGVMVLLANPWAVNVLIQQDFPGVTENTGEAVLRADCYTGGFAAAVWNESLKSKTIGGVVALSAGDLDEAVLALLDYSGTRSVGGLDVTFTRFRSFRNGFLNGYDNCQAGGS